MLCFTEPSGRDAEKRSLPRRLGFFSFLVCAVRWGFVSACAPGGTGAGHWRVAPLDNNNKKRELLLGNARLGAENAVFYNIEWAGCRKTHAPEASRAAVRGSYLHARQGALVPDTGA